MGMVVMRLELIVRKVRSKWLVELRRFPDKLKSEKFNTKGEAINVMWEWGNELINQNRRFEVTIKTASGKPKVQIGYDHDGSIVRRPDQKWRDSEMQLRFYNQYGDRTLFLKTEDWTFAEKLIIDMKEQNNWGCQVTQSGKEIRA